MIKSLILITFCTEWNIAVEANFKERGVNHINTFVNTYNIYLS